MKASCVIHVGGSLLDLPDLPARLGNILADFSRPRPLVTCGGGETVSLIRRWARIHRLGEEAGHRLAVRALGLNARLLRRIVPSLEVASGPDRLQAIWEAKKVPILDAFRFLRDVDEKSEEPLPRRWRVTSDSISARMAVRLGAEELVLLKSVTYPEGITVEEAARRGLVDPHFPTASRGLSRIVVINLRDEEPRESSLGREL